MFLLKVIIAGVSDLLSKLRCTFASPRHNVSEVIFHLISILIRHLQFYDFVLPFPRYKDCFKDLLFFPIIVPFSQFSNDVLTIRHLLKTWWHRPVRGRAREVTEAWPPTTNYFRKNDNLSYNDNRNCGTIVVLFLPIALEWPCNRYYLLVRYLSGISF